jgi:hypothetical protein
MKFERANFDYSGGYLHYEGKFIARFKHVASNKPTFLTFLIKNFTQEEYFEATSGNGIDNTPVKVLESKGYVAAHIRKMLKQEGYSVDRAGYDAYLDDCVAKYANK